MTHLRSQQICSKCENQFAAARRRSAVRAPSDIPCTNEGIAETNRIGNLLRKNVKQTESEAGSIAELGSFVTRAPMRAANIFSAKCSACKRDESRPGSGMNSITARERNPDGKRRRRERRDAPLSFATCNYSLRNHWKKHKIFRLTAMREQLAQIIKQFLYYYLISIAVHSECFIAMSARNRGEMRQSRQERVKNGKKRSEDVLWQRRQSRIRHSHGQNFSNDPITHKNGNESFLLPPGELAESERERVSVDNRGRLISF